jgi:hypothetical protein
MKNWFGLRRFENWSWSWERVVRSRGLLANVRGPSLGVTLKLISILYVSQLLTHVVAARLSGAQQLPVVGLDFVFVQRYEALLQCTAARISSTGGKATQYLYYRPDVALILLAFLRPLSNLKGY